ncbi:MAG: hypothetical protein K6C30_02425 [Bacteroidaceae bacterium]|nr:hypothetical protein [Bacteroidaceae bacterium]
MNVINEKIVDTTMEQLSTLVEDAVNCVKEYGSKLLSKAQKEFLPLMEDFIKNIKGDIKGTALGKEVETLDLATLVAFAKKYIVPGCNEIVAMKMQETDATIIYLSYSKDRQLLPADQNRYLIIKAKQLAADISELFNESEIVILK